MNDEFILRVDAVTFSYQVENPVVDIPAMEFHSSQVSVLLGANGTGKTTLLKLLAGILEVGSGTITVHTEAGDRQVSWPDDLLYIHQSPYLLTGTVEQSLAKLLPGLRKQTGGKTGLNERITVVLSEMRLAELSGRSVHKLSGGEKKRVAIAGALLADREIILLDEPTAHLDEKSILQLEKQVLQLKHQGKAVIIATHNKEFAFRLADVIWHMEHGKSVPMDYSGFRGKIWKRDEYFSYFQVEGTDPPIDLKVVHAPETVTTAVVRSSDIILSSQPLESSAMNSFSGIIAKVNHLGDRGVLLHVECGSPAGISLKAVVTERSFEQMQLAKGARVFAVFKTSAVQLF